MHTGLQFSRSVVSDSLRPRGLQHARLPCPSLSPGVCSDSCPSSRWCHPTTSSSAVPSPPAFSLPRRQGLFQGVSSWHQVAQVLECETAWRALALENCSCCVLLVAVLCLAQLIASVRCPVVPDSATPWTVAHQAPLSIEFSRQEHLSQLSFPSPGDLPDPRPSEPPGPPWTLPFSPSLAFSSHVAVACHAKEIAYPCLVTRWFTHCFHTYS